MASSASALIDEVIESDFRAEIRQQSNELNGEKHTGVTKRPRQAEK
jgi:hypothetical protein